MSHDRYHHGDLANALLAAALRKVEGEGAEAVSLRDLAETLGVSRAAPYRHFASRDELLAAVAAVGFEELVRVYDQALSGPGDGRARLIAASRAFFAFAVRRPGLYSLMFESDFLSRTPPPAVLLPAANASWRQLWRAVEEAFPAADRREVKMRTVLMVSTAHGFIALERKGRFKPFMVEPLTVEEMTEAVLLTAAHADLALPWS